MNQLWFNSWFYSIIAACVHHIIVWCGPPLFRLEACPPPAIFWLICSTVKDSPGDMLLQGFVFENGRGALNCSPERFKGSWHENDYYEHHWNVTSFRWAKHCSSNLEKINPKRAGLFWPISTPPPLKISETDRWNIKCVVLVDSYDPPESIGTKKFKTYLVWRHSDVIRDVMSKTRKTPKIAKIMVFRYFFKQKLHFLAMMCVKVCLHMFLLQINQINKIKHSHGSVSWKTKKTKNTICV